MGMFDTIIFDRPIPCPKCGAEIGMGYTKVFEGMLHRYRIGDCVAPTDVSRVFRDQHCCAECRNYTSRHYFMVVYHGVLVGITQDLPGAQTLLRSLSTEQLLALYHELYRRREHAQSDSVSTVSFMHRVCQWFEGGYDKLAPEDWCPLPDTAELAILVKCDTPLAALRQFLAQREAEAKAGGGAGQLDLW